MSIISILIELSLKKDTIASFSFYRRTIFSELFLNLIFNSSSGIFKLCVNISSSISSISEVIDKIPNNDDEGKESSDSNVEISKVPSKHRFGTTLFPQIPSIDLTHIMNMPSRFLCQHDHVNLLLCMKGAF